MAIDPPQRRPASTTNALLVLTIVNHASWSTLHVAARYLQVYAQPVTFDWQGVLSSTKGFAALFLFLLGVSKSCIEVVVHRWKNGAANNYAGTTMESLPPGADPSFGASCSLSSSNSNDLDSDGGDEMPEQNDDSFQQDKQTSDMPIPSQTTLHPTISIVGSTEQATLQRKRLMYTLLFAFASTTRASTNIASAKWTYPYNITLIASLTPIIIAVFDHFLLRSPFPPLMWPTIFLSSLGGSFIAASQSFDNDNADKSVTPTDNLIGCLLQLVSAVFSAFARILMKRTEGILTPTHIVQTNNISNCLIPFVYTMVRNPSSWGAFRYLIFNPKSLVAWCAISIGVYSFASTLQIRLVRKLGPGFYSSWVAVRVLGSMILSTFVLGEGIKSWLEWVGIGIMIVTISVYLVETRRWMENRAEAQEDEEENDASEEEGGGKEEELVRLRTEDRPLLAGAGISSSSNH